MDLRRKRAVAADAVDGPIAGGGEQPPARIGRYAGDRPPFGGDGKRLLCGVLGAFEVAEVADQGRQYAAPLIAEDLPEVDQPGCSTVGRISTPPPSRACGIRAAISIA
jgi:hypothetical protein